jgi:hypothetical protein
MDGVAEDTHLVALMTRVQANARVWLPDAWRVHVNPSRWAQIQKQRELRPRGEGAVSRKRGHLEGASTEAPTAVLLVK